MEYCFCKPLGLIVVTAKSAISSDEMRAFHRRMLDDPEIPPGMRELMDLRKLDVVVLDAKVVREIVAVESVLSERIGAAQIAVVASLPVAFGLSRMYETLSEPMPMKVSVFSEIGPALEWLAISPKQLRQYFPDFEF